MVQHTFNIQRLVFSSLLCIFFGCITSTADIANTQDNTIVSAYDTTVTASSSVTNMMNVSYESQLRSTLIGSDGSAPGDVHYSFSIASDNKSTDAGAIGSARSAFTVTSHNGRDTGTNLSSERIWRDITEVSGTIVNFRKNFDYASGIRI